MRRVTRQYWLRSNFLFFTPAEVGNLKRTSHSAMSVCNCGKSRLSLVNGNVDFCLARWWRDLLALASLPICSKPSFTDHSVLKCVSWNDFSRLSGSGLTVFKFETFSSVCHDLTQSRNSFKSALKQIFPGYTKCVSASQSKCLPVHQSVCLSAHSLA